ncbi:hypothetical protein AB0I60_08455 [Actinosynnema sp. NPDC050436]|uniref:hypothetical protein n=1 Tax=Actinosynnema sp. NPDC050436 TaxID=3155659 RepID=UPI00340C69BE
MGRSVLAGLVIGTMVVAMFLMLMMTGSPGGTSGSLPANVIAVGMVSVFLGGVPGTLIGVVVGLSKTRRTRALPPPALIQPMLLPPPPPPPPLVRRDRWAASVGRAELSVRRVYAVVDTVPPSPARDWMGRIAGQFEAELGNVRRIADLGRALDADGDHPVVQRLQAAVRDFTAFEGEVGSVALRMVDHTSLDAARVHLEVLEQQLPQLGHR